VGARRTDVLYGGDRENRLRQELVRGVGGVAVLRALGLEPTVFHLNEGHSAFLQLERMRVFVEEEGLSADEALERLRASTVFTTHTPVPAGNEVFDPALVRRNLDGLVERCGPDMGRVRCARQGRARGHRLRADAVSRSAPRSTRTASRSCTVRLSREMWQPPLAGSPGRPGADHPRSRTACIPSARWLSPELERLLWRHRSAVPARAGS